MKANPILRSKLFLQTKKNLGHPGLGNAYFTTSFKHLLCMRLTS